MPSSQLHECEMIEKRGRPRKNKRKVHPIAATLQKERIMKGLTLAQLTDRLGYGDDAIGSWERGDYAPGLTKLEDWCQSLGYKLKLERLQSPIKRGD